MKYKVGDRVRVQSLDWYEKNKNKFGSVPLGQFSFNFCNTHLCGAILTIKKVQHDYYLVEENSAYWTDEMIEGLVEEETKLNIIEEAKTYWDSIKDAWICPEGYIFKDENGNVINATKIVLEKKRPKYPQSYEECAEIIAEYTGSDCNPKGCMGYKSKLLTSFQKLLICRDAYWKIAGEEWKLKYPWHPKWDRTDIIHHIITYAAGAVYKDISIQLNYILAFPTEEMRDAFYENFKKEIELVKELL